MGGQILVKISRDGSSTETHVDGVPGAKCEDVTRSMLEAIGEIQSNKKTPEYYQEDLSVVGTHV